MNPIDIDAVDGEKYRLVPISGASADMEPGLYLGIELYNIIGRREPQPFVARWSRDPRTGTVFPEHSNGARVFWTHRIEVVK